MCILIVKKSNTKTLRKTYVTPTYYKSSIVSNMSTHIKKWAINEPLEIIPIAIALPRGVTYIV